MLPTVTCGRQLFCDWLVLMCVKYAILDDEAERSLVNTSMTAVYASDAERSGNDPVAY